MERKGCLSKFFTLPETSSPYVAESLIKETAISPDSIVLDIQNLTFDQLIEKIVEEMSNKRNQTFVFQLDNNIVHLTRETIIQLAVNLSLHINCIIEGDDNGLHVYID